MGKSKDRTKALKEELNFLDEFSWELLSVAVRCGDFQLVRMFLKLHHFIDHKVIQEADK